jgi:hypothetical protein
MKGRMLRTRFGLSRIIRCVLSPCHLATLSPCLILLLAGCNGDNRREGDPLLGAPVAGPAALPPPSSSGSTAALAGGTSPSRPADSRSGLQIGSGTPPTALVSATPNAPALRPPEPTAHLTSNPIPSTGSTAPMTPHLASYEQAQVTLLGKGIKWQQLQMTGDPGEWSFSCSLPDRQNPAMSRTYSGKGPNYLAAMQAVLDQMEREGR